MAEPERLLCDTSFVGHIAKRKAHPNRYAHWDARTVERIEQAVLGHAVVGVQHPVGGGHGALVDDRVRALRVEQLAPAGSDCDQRVGGQQRVGAGDRHARSPDPRLGRGERHVGEHAAALLGEGRHTISVG